MRVPLLLPALSVASLAVAQQPVEAWLDGAAEHLGGLYRHLHEHPELSLREQETAARMADELRALGLEVTEKVGGTGVVTIGAMLTMGAHLEGHSFSSVDQFGMAQKGGAVTSHIRLALSDEDIAAVRLNAGSADLVLGCDSLVAGDDLALSVMAPARRVPVPVPPRVALPPMELTVPPPPPMDWMTRAAESLPVEEREAPALLTTRMAPPSLFPELLSMPRKALPPMVPRRPPPPPMA